MGASQKKETNTESERVYDNKIATALNFVNFYVYYEQCALFLMNNVRYIQINYNDNEVCDTLQ